MNAFPLSLVLAASLVAAGCGNRTRAIEKAPDPALPAVTNFPAANASNALARTADFIRDCTPRDAGTPGAEKAARWLAASLAAGGFEGTNVLSCFSPEGVSVCAVDTFTNATPHGSCAFRNVLAAVPAREPSDKWIVLLSHFDTKSGIGPRFEGANDGASSTGLLLELASWFRRRPLRDVNLFFGFMDGEECMSFYGPSDGFHGSRRLAKQLEGKKKKVLAVILMDMVGDADLRLTIPRNCTGALRLLSLEAAETVGVRDRIGLFDGYVYDDHHAFFEAGFPAVDLIDFEYGSAPGENDYWHTEADTFDTLSSESLYTTAKIVLEMIRRLVAP